jgi:hypothetical protein
VSTPPAVLPTLALRERPLPTASLANPATSRMLSRARTKVAPPATPSLAKATPTPRAKALGISEERVSRVSHQADVRPLSLCSRCRPYRHGWRCLCYCARSWSLERWRRRSFWRCWRTLLYVRPTRSDRRSCWSRCRCRRCRTRQPPRSGAQ